MYFVSLLYLFLSISEPSDIITLNDLKWENRVIVALSNDSDRLARIDQELKKNSGEIRNRDLVYFLISPDTTFSNSGSYLSLENMGDLVHTYFKNQDTLRILLIGKDGGVKLNEGKFDLKQILRVIDSMPMRRSEIKEGGY